MRTRSVLLTALLACTLITRAQNPGVLQMSKFSGGSYPQLSSNQGSLYELTNLFNVTVGSTSAGAVDYDENTGALTGYEGSIPPNGGIFYYNFNFTNNFTGNVMLTTNAYYCVTCDAPGNPNNFSQSANNNFSWNFGNDPLGKLVTPNTTDFYTQYLIRVPAPQLNSSAGTGISCTDNVTLSAQINWANLSGLTYRFE